VVVNEMVLDTEKRIHGGLDPREARAHGVDPESVLDLSVNINPHGPCTPVLEAARSALLERYPDPTGLAARVAWSRTLNVPPDAIAVGAGAADLFWSITRAFVAAGDRVVIAEPTFSELRVAANAAGARVERVFADAETGHRIDLLSLLRRAHGARLVYLCAPNNPTGQGFELSELESFARDLGETYLVLDQSFLSLSERADDLARRLPRNVICVRSLTKDFGVPGLRIGLALASPEVVRGIEGARPTWAVSAPALAAIETAARQTAFVASSYRELRRQREQVSAVLRRTGWTTFESETVFLLVRVGQAPVVRSELLRRRVLVRDATSFGLPDCVRIAVRTQADSERLGQALQDLLVR
jgi:histidinol-phosphate aminotransferase